MTILQTDALVIDSLADGPYQRLRLHTPDMAIRIQAGQFVTADLGKALRQPLLPATVTKEEIELLLPATHPLARTHPGQKVNLLGPLGRPFRLPQPPCRLLLIADATHLPLLLPAASRATAEGYLLALLLAAPTAAAVYPLSRLPPAMEIHLLTADGSAGQSGSLLDQEGPLPRLLAWADRALLAADPTLYPRLAETVRNTRMDPGADFAQAILLPTIVCGVGACLGCAVTTRRGYRQACSDGPTFDLLELESE